MGIWCWGRNEQRSELGSGDQGSSTCPSPFSADLLPSSRNVTQVALGQDHILVLAQGEVWSCGNNDHGQLGLGKQHSSPRATAIPQLSRSRVDVCAISAGNRHSLALSTTGSVFVWGSNDCGQLGLGVDHGSLHHFPVLNINLEKARFVVCGGNHSIVGLEAGGTFAFGCNEFGQLGIGMNVEDRRVCNPTLCILSGEVAAAAAGGHHTVFVDADRSVWACGRGMSGQLGLGVDNRVEAVWIPTRITMLDDALCSNKHGSTRDVVEQVACGTHHSAVRTRLGNMYTFGSNLHGQLGHGLAGPDESGIFSVPRLVRYDSERNPVGLISNISCGHDHTMALSDMGHVMSWGDNSCGQLGQGSRSSSCASLPSRVRMQQDCRGARLFAGGQFSLLLVVEQSGMAADVQGGLLQAELEETRQKLSAMKSIVGDLEDILRQQQQQVHLAQDAQRVGDERKARALEEAAKAREMVRNAGNELLGNIESVSQIVESVKDVVKSENAALEEAERSRAERAKEASERMEANVEALEKQLAEAKKNAEEARKEAERERQREKEREEELERKLQQEKRHVEEARKEAERERQREEELEKKLEQEKKNAEEARKEAEIERGKEEKLGRQLEEQKKIMEDARGVDKNVWPETRRLEQGTDFGDVGDADVDSTIVERKGASVLKVPLILPLQGGVFTLEYTAGGLGNVKVNEKVTNVSLACAGELTETQMSKKEGSGATVVYTGVGAAGEAKAEDERHGGDAWQRDTLSGEAEERQIAVRSGDMLRQQVVESDAVNAKALQRSVASIAPVDESDSMLLDADAAMTAPNQTSNGDADVAKNTTRDAVVNTAKSDAKAGAPTDEKDGEVRKDQLQQQASAQQEAHTKPSSGEVYGKPSSEETQGVGSIESADAPLQEIIENNEDVAEDKAGEARVAEGKAGDEAVAEAKAGEARVAEGKAGDEGVAEAKAGDDAVAEVKPSDDAVAEGKAGDEGVAEVNKPSEEGVAEVKAGEARVAEAKAGDEGVAEVNKPSEEAVAEVKAGEARVAEAKAGDEGVAEAKAGDDAVAEAKADDDAVAEGKAGDEGVAEVNKPSEEAVAEAKAGDEGVAEAKAGEARVAEAEAGDEGVAEVNKPSDGAVAEVKPSDDAVAEAKAGKEAVAEAKPSEEGVAEGKAGDEGVAEAKAGDDAVAEAKAGDDAVAEAKAGDDAVAEAKAGDDAVAEGKAGDEGVAEVNKPSDGAVAEVKPSDGAVAEAKAGKEGVAEAKPSEEGVAEGKAGDDAVAEVKAGEARVAEAEAGDGAVAEVKAKEEVVVEPKDLGESSCTDADGAPAEMDVTAEKKGGEGDSDGANKGDTGGLEREVSTLPSSVNDSIIDDSIADDVIEEGEDDEDQDYDPFSVANGD